MNPIYGTDGSVVEKRNLGYYFVADFVAVVALTAAFAAWMPTGVDNDAAGYPRDTSDRYRSNLAHSGFDIVDSAVVDAAACPAYSGVKTYHFVC